jgi:hypothetical protein
LPACRQAGGEKIVLVKKIINIFAVTEIFIGGLTLVSVITALILNTSTKPFNVLIFVIIASLISFLLGVGLLMRNPQAYYIILYFSITIIISKILISTGIISLNGALETSIPASLKNIFSLVYHGLILVVFNLKNIRKEFIKY